MKNRGLRGCRAAMSRRTQRSRGGTSPPGAAGRQSSSFRKSCPCSQGLQASRAYPSTAWARRTPSAHMVTCRSEQPSHRVRGLPRLRRSDSSRMPVRGASAAASRGTAMPTPEAEIFSRRALSPHRAGRPHTRTGFPAGAPAGRETGTGQAQNPRATSSGSGTVRGKSRCWTRSTRAGRTRLSRSARRPRCPPHIRLENRKT